MADTTEFVFREPSMHSRELYAADAATLSPSYTRSYGLSISHGKGAEIWDLDGNRYIDFASGIAVMSTGFSHPRVVEAIKAQAEKYTHIGATDFFCPVPVTLAQRLQTLVPIHRADAGDKLVYFGNSGTEAIEAALKLARYRTGRSHVIAFYGSFHGRTMGSLSVTASKNVQRAGYPHIPDGVTHVPYPGRNSCEGCDDAGCCKQCWCDAVGFIERFVLKKVAADEIAAVIVEPIQGEGGYIVPRDDFLPRLRDFCDRYGILLIADEIQSGVGRTGRFCAMEHWGVAADIVCLAKGLASGVPIGAVVAHRDVMSRWVPGAHASTFGGNPLACAAAIATLEVIEEEDLMIQAETLGSYTLQRLRRMMASHPAMTRADGKGLMIGIDFSDQQGAAFPAFRDRVVDACYLKGLVTLGCGSSGLRFAPALVITKEQIDEGLEILERAIAETEEEMLA
jgi:4-aminobutyrate aminotransferase